jgi:hypothetical protein
LPENDFYTPNDIDELRMENELLAFEVRYLKARLAEPDRARAELQARVDRLEGLAANLKQELRERTISPKRRRRLERAEEDLTYLLWSLSRSPLARLFRLKKGFRVLEQQYLSGR